MRKTLLSLEIGAWCLGLLCAGVPLYVHVEARAAQQAADHLGTPAALPGAAVPQGPAAEENRDTVEGVIGRMEIPSIGLRVPILNNYDPGSLRKGVGRIHGTAVPGGLGNFAVAGHRDTFFRPLRRIRLGMTIHVVTGEGTYDYVVDSTTVVTPEDIGVLDIGDRPEMTLITCYPFDFIGAAPKRFIVRAHLISLDPTANNGG